MSQLTIGNFLSASSVNHSLRDLRTRRKLHQLARYDRSDDPDPSGGPAEDARHDQHLVESQRRLQEDVKTILEKSTKLDVVLHTIRTLAD